MLGPTFLMLSATLAALVLLYVIACPCGCLRSTFN